MNYYALKLIENDALLLHKQQDTIHLAGNNFQKPTIGYGYDIKQNGFNANDLNTKANIILITQDQMNTLKSYCENLVQISGESDEEYEIRTATIKKDYMTLMNNIVITREQADTLLENTVKNYETALNNLLNSYSITLNYHQKSALVSVFYNTCGPTISSIESEHPTVSALLKKQFDASELQKSILNMGIWYEILYNTNAKPKNNTEDERKGIQNRRFVEANEFLGIELSTKPIQPNEVFCNYPVQNIAEAKALFYLLNENATFLTNKLSDIPGYTKKIATKCLQDNLIAATNLIFNDLDGLDRSLYALKDLFKSWTIQSSLTLQRDGNKRLTGNIKEKSSITGSSLNDIIICEINDSLVSGNHNNTINADSGNDIIYAGSGNDTINAGVGNDTLIGGSGRDVLNGGTGADTYEFNIGDGYDVIKETGNDVNTIKINASISSFEAFRLNINEVVLRSTVNDNHIRIQGSENFQIIFSDATTTLAVMLQGNDQVPADTEVCPLNQTPFYVPSTGKQFIYLPENFQGVVDLRNLSPGVEVFGIAKETYVLLPSGVSIETDATTGKIILKNQGQTVGTLTGSAGGSDNAGMFVIGTGFLCQLDATGQVQIKWIERLSELRQDVRFYLSQNKETAENKRSPLAIDLDGDGVETVSVANGVHFDHDGNGFAEKSGWISADDALLVRDVNEDGEINDGSELFGDQTALSNGEKAANGFEALADLDSNKDGVFDGDDDAFGEVMVWQDKNQNGIAEYDELQSLEESGITSINLDYQSQSVTDANGNEHKQTGTAVNFDKTTSAVSDVWFKADYMDAQDKTEVEISAEIEALPDIKAFGNVHSLHTAMALDESLRER